MGAGAIHTLLAGSAGLAAAGCGGHGRLLGWLRGTDRGRRGVHADAAGHARSSAVGVGRRLEAVWRWGEIRAGGGAVDGGLRGHTRDPRAACRGDGRRAVLRRWRVASQGLLSGRTGAGSRRDWCLSTRNSVGLVDRLSLLGSWTLVRDALIRDACGRMGWCGLVPGRWRWHRCSPLLKR